MPLRKNFLSGKSLAPRHVNGRKSAGPSPASFARPQARGATCAGLLGVPETVFLDQQLGAAVHLHDDLVSPYKDVPPQPGVHFRSLANRRRTPPRINCTKPVNTLSSTLMARKTPKNAKNIHATKAGMSHGISGVGQKWGLDRKPECPLETT
ncbi:MAG TPA: hypothetical protein VGZ29_14085 [Terriglobia bacterium]|nr:hypothetical protein [Terriglobia bacterium]